MFDSLLRSRLDQGLFLVAVFLSAVTLTTGALAVQAHEARWDARVVPIAVVQAPSVVQAPPDLQLAEVQLVSTEA